MASLSEYGQRYEHIALQRDDDGVLEVKLHTDGASLRWGPQPHAELCRAFHDISDDRENRVVILTGTGDEFTGPICSPGERPLAMRPTPQEWDHFYFDGKHLQANLLNIEVPMIAAINGPAYRHLELALLCDITIAADTAVFVDSGHFEHGNLVPGDGVNVVMTMLVGINRARYFHLTGQTIDAREALELGMVNEVLPSTEVMPRARAIARQLARKSNLQLRYSRVILTEPIKQQMHRLVGYGMALEGLAISDPSSGFPTN
ncbi:MAG: enoyl-CoA hydratase/isomerase family protein [Acidimicrobiales bacterium]